MNNEIRDTLQYHLASMAVLFKPGVRVTFYARHPDFPGSDLYLSDDEASEVLSGIRKLVLGDQHD